jgi:hypothetical protein
LPGSALAGSEAIHSPSNTIYDDGKIAVFANE